jgi:DNA polymerase III alpha subunit (gram-positive type)
MQRYARIIWFLTSAGVDGCAGKAIGGYSVAGVMISGNDAMKRMLADSVVVLDFETTGLSPAYGDRAIEIGAALLEHGVIVDRFQKLMNPGFRISRFIESYTGIAHRYLASLAESC